MLEWLYIFSWTQTCPYLLLPTVGKKAERMLLHFSRACRRGQLFTNGKKKKKTCTEKVFESFIWRAFRFSNFRAVSWIRSRSLVFVVACCHIPPPHSSYPSLCFVCCSPYPSSYAPCLMPSHVAYVWPVVCLCLFCRGKAILLPALPIPSISEREPKDARAERPPHAFRQQPVPRHEELVPEPGGAEPSGRQTRTKSAMTPTTDLTVINWTAASAQTTPETQNLNPTLSIDS